MLRAGLKWRRLADYFNTSERVIDIGSGNGCLAELIQANGHEILTSDIRDKRANKDLPFHLIEELPLPFSDKSFDLCTLITVLHHTTNQIDILKEAGRLSKRILIMEDVYGNKLQKQLTYFTDSLVNVEFNGHPHTNRTHEEWLKLFRELNLKVVDLRTDSTLLLFTQNIYLLES